MRFRHGGAIGLFAVLAVAWTWPLALHMSDALPGPPGDNYSFIWYLWWMRRALASPDVDFFRTTWLFHPFGASITNNPHTALPAFVAATVMGRVPLVTAQNILILFYVFANMAAMYALAFDVTEHFAAATLAALFFGLSPYMAAHLPGHFELMAAWTLPLFALFFRRACVRASRTAAILAGLVAGATAYTSYYYFVYQALLALMLLLAWSTSAFVSASRRDDAGARKYVRALLAAVIALLMVALVIAWTGGGRFTLGSIAVSATQPQGALTWVWVLLAAVALVTWRIRIAIRPSDSVTWWQALTIGGLALATAFAAAAPLLVEGLRLMRTGEYVAPTFNWRGAPHGIDLAVLLAGHPYHAVWGSFSFWLYEMLQVNPVEAIGWIGVVPLWLLLALPISPDDRRERRMWRAVAVAFTVWALGSYLMIAGFDTGLRMPVFAARWIPFVSNVRMPGRAMLVVYLALAMLIALRVRSANGRLASPLWQTAAAIAIVVDFWIAPITLTPIDRPPALVALAAQGPGAVCEVPFGIGDGLRGTGSQDRLVLYDATIHQHPVVGGILGRMPNDADRYESMPVVGDLLRLAEGHPATPPADLRGSPCDFLVVQATATWPMRKYIDALPHTLVARDEHVSVYSVRR